MVLKGSSLKLALCLLLCAITPQAQAEWAFEAGAALGLPRTAASNPLPVHALAGLTLSLPNQLQLGFKGLYAQRNMIAAGHSLIQWDLTPELRRRVPLLAGLSLTPAAGLAWENQLYRGSRASKWVMNLSLRINIGHLFSEVDWRAQSLDLPLSASLGWQSGF